MSIWSRFTSWLSGWPESKDRKSEREQIYLFAEEEELRTKQEGRLKVKVKKKPKGLNLKKKTFWNHGDTND